MGLDRADCLHLIFCRRAPVITVDNALDEFLRKPHRTNFHTLAIKKFYTLREIIERFTCSRGRITGIVSIAKCELGKDA